MAATELKPIYLTDYDVFVKETLNTAFAAVDADEGAYLNVSGRDEQYVIGITNTHQETAKAVTIKAGNHIQSEFGDITISLDAGEITWIVLSSGKFKNVFGDNKSKIIITGDSTDIEVKVIRLPF